MPVIRIKRVYDPPAAEDGLRVLVDRVWPRGVKKETLSLDAWLHGLAPSATLRRWFGHDPKKWEGFRRRYTAELDRNPEGLAWLLETARGEDVTLLYGARDVENNNAVLLRDYLQAKLSRGRARR